LIVVLHPHTAGAQDSTAAAEALFNEARSAMAEKKFDTACDKFRESNRLDPALGTLFNLANCEEQRGRLATASALYRQVIERLPAGDGRLPVAKDRALALDARVPRLTLRARHALPAGTVITVAGLARQAASLGSPILLDPGTYRVLVLTPGKATQQYEVTLSEGDSAEFPVDAVPSTPAVFVAAPSDQSARDRRQLFAYVAGGVGVTAMTIGFFSGLAALHQKSLGDHNCNDQTRTCNQAGLDANGRARTFARISSVGLVVGVVGLGLGTYVWMTLPEPKRAPDAMVLAGWGTRW